MTQQDPNKFLMGGGKVPGFKFEGTGSSVTGIIKDLAVRQQRDIKTDELKYWDDGNPMMQLVVTLATELRDPAIEGDNGNRRIYVKGKMQYAVRDAVEEAKVEGLELGGRLTVTQTGTEEPKNRGMSATKLYGAKYVSAANVALATTPPAASAPQQNVEIPAQPTAPPVQQPSPQDAAAVAAAVAALTPQQKLTYGLPLSPEEKATLGLPA